MTNIASDAALLEEDIENTEEITKINHPSIQKVSRFGPSGFQGGSKFGKGPTGNNPQLKQRPGRAAARGR